MCGQLVFMCEVVGAFEAQGIARCLRCYKIQGTIVFEVQLQILLRVGEGLLI